MENEPVNLQIYVSKEECERAVGRKVSQKEFEEFANYVRKGVEWSIDWDDIHQEAGNKLKEEEK